MQNHGPLKGPSRNQSFILKMAKTARTTLAVSEASLFGYGLRLKMMFKWTDNIS